MVGAMSAGKISQWTLIIASLALSLPFGPGHLAAQPLPEGKAAAVEEKTVGAEAVIRTKDEDGFDDPLQEVINDYNVQLKADPKDVEAWFTLGLAYHTLGKLTEAEKSYRKVLSLSPQDPDAMINLGAVLQKQGRMSEAIERYKATIAAHPKMPEPYFNLGLAYAQIHEEEMAIVSFKTAAEVSPDFLPAHFHLADLYHRGLDYSRTEQAYLKIIKLAVELGKKIDPRSENGKAKTDENNTNLASAYNNLANMYFEQGQSGKAFEHYQKAIELKPDDPELFYNQGLAFFKVNKLDEAEQSYKKAIDKAYAKKLDYAEAYNNLGVVYGQKGQNSEMMGMFEKSCAADPRFLDAHFNLGLTYFRDKRYDEAIKKFQDSLNIKSDYADAHAYLGEAYFKKGIKYRKVALDHLRKAIYINPGKSEFQAKLGIVYLEDGKLADAESIFRKALSLNPEDVGARENLGRMFLQQGKLDKALEQLEEGLRVEPKNAELHFLLSRVYTNKGNLDQAVEHDKKGLEIDPSRLEENLSLGDLYLKLKILDLAVAQYAAAIKLDPKSALAHHRMGEVFGQRGNRTDQIRYYEKAIQLNPKLTDARCDLAYAYSQDRQMDKAIAELEKVVKEAPSVAKGHYYLAVLYYNKAYSEKQTNHKLLQLSTEEYKKAIQADPKHVLAHHKLGKLYWESGDKDNARKAFETALKLAPESPDIKLDLDKLKGGLPPK